MKALRLMATGAALAASIAIATPAQAVPYGSISGHVTDDAGTPLANVCVTAYGFDYWYEAVTDADGAYAFESLPANEYVVHFQDCGEPWTHVPEWFDDRRTFDQANPVWVEPGYVSVIDVSLTIGGKISGHLTDTTGAPAPDVCISIVDGGRERLGWSRSREDGSYSVGGLRTGNVFVEFSECNGSPIPGPRPSARYGYATAWYHDKPGIDSADPVGVTAPNTTAGIDAVLVPAGRISGWLTGPGGAPASSVYVKAHDRNGGTWEWARTDEDGRYAINGLAPGTYEVGFEDAQRDDPEYKDEWYNDRKLERDANPVVVSSGVDTSGIDAELARVPRPDVGIDSLRVESVPLQTDLGALASTPGRRIRVTVGNHGNADTVSSALTLWATTPTNQVARQIASMQVGVVAGGSVERTVDWNALGTVGDVTITAQVCQLRDHNPSNDQSSIESYVVVGGSGFGVQTGTDADVPPCSWGDPSM